MGCDIHCYVESRTDKGWNFIKEIGVNRQYNLFAILADVRNGIGFAGIDTGERFNPISLPKGLPEDLSEEVKIEADNWDGDGHSFSWLTIEEILNYDYTQKRQTQGYVGMQNYITYLKQGSPNCWCNDISGLDIKKISNEEMNEIIKNNKKKLNEIGNVYTKINWVESYYDLIGVKDSEFFETLRNLKEEHGEGNVRIIFWFDN